MSTRGIKFNFSVGEIVLCFEPDPSKARVLYNAKILDSTVSRDPQGNKVAAYHIHFQGWNHSWDRTVAEIFILKNTEENKALMKKLAETTKKFRINKRRNKRIDRILRKAFDGNHPLFDYDSDLDSADDDNDDFDDANSSDNEVEFKESLSDYTGDEEKENRHGNSSQSEEDFERKIDIELDIPQKLKDVLERDFLAVNRENLLLKLPAENDNVVMILEGFVKNFCVNLLCGSPIKSSKEGPYIPFEKNIPLCKELVDGLRICFDYTLPLILLYGPEREQLKKLTSTFRNKSPQKSISQTATPRSPTKGKAVPKPASLTNQSNGESSPKIPKLSPKIFKDKIGFDEPFESSKIEDLSRRRMTRRSLHEHESSKKSERQKSPFIDVVSSSDDNEDKKPPEIHRKRGWNRGRKFSENSVPESSAKGEISSSSKGKCGDGKTQKSRGERPPPLLIPSAIVTETGNDSKASSVDEDPVTYQEDVVDRILAWQLLPSDMTQISTNAPSLIYGAHHLLRLFVKLPDLISNMDMERCKVRVLLTLLQHFLDYFMERHDELFQDSAYVSAEEAC